jgi:hypothetical protein
VTAEGIELVDIGRLELRGVSDPIHAFGVNAEGVPWVDREPRTVRTLLLNLPTPLNEWFGPPTRPAGRKTTPAGMPIFMSEQVWPVRSLDPDLEGVQLFDEELLARLSVRPSGGPTRLHATRVADRWPRRPTRWSTRWLKWSARRWPTRWSLNRLSISAVLVPGIGIVVNGARAWIPIGPFALEPSEFAKLALLVYGADLLARRAHHIADAQVTLRRLLVVTGMGALFIVAEHDLGPAIVIVMIAVSVAFIAGRPIVPLTGALVVMGVGAGMATMQARILTRPLDGLPQPRGAQERLRFPGLAVAHRHRLGRPHGRRVGSGHVQVGIPSRSPH